MADYGDNMKMSKAAAPSGSMNTNGGHDPGTKRLEKHPLKSPFWKQKKMKGDC